MSKQRTKEQKRRAQERRQQGGSQASLNQVSVGKLQIETQEVPVDVQPVKTNIFSEALSRAVQKQSPLENSSPNLDLQSFFGFDPKLIYRDLAKTIAISAVILILLVVFSRLPF